MNTTLIVRVPIKLRRQGSRKTIVTPAGTLPMPARVDITLVKALARAFRWRKLLEQAALRGAGGFRGGGDAVALAGYGQRWLSFTQGARMGRAYGKCQVRTMAKGYLVGELVVTNPAGYEEYRRQVPAIIAAHHGRYVVRAGDATRVEGGGTAGRVVVVEFPSLESAKVFYYSPEYQAILPYRTNNSTGVVTIVEGVE